MSLAFSMSNRISGSRSFGTRLSSTASLRHFFRSPTCREGFSPNMRIISFPSTTGCSSRL